MEAINWIILGVALVLFVGAFFFFKKQESELENKFSRLSQEALKTSKEDFLQLAGEVLDAKQKQAQADLEQRKQAVEGSVTALKEQLEEYKRLIRDFEKDRAKSNEIIKFSDGLNQLLKALSPSVSDEKRQAIEAYFWMVEEYKVSVFAQELKTAIPISAKRLDKKLKEIGRMV